VTVFLRRAIRVENMSLEVCDLLGGERFSLVLGESGLAVDGAIDGIIRLDRLGSDDIGRCRLGSGGWTKCFHGSFQTTTTGERFLRVMFHYSCRRHLEQAPIIVVHNRGQEIGIEGAR
jgi:hypothetical protein